LTQKKKGERSTPRKNFRVEDLKSANVREAGLNWKLLKGTFSLYVGPAERMIRRQEGSKRDDKSQNKENNRKMEAGGKKRHIIPGAKSGHADRQR